jgi:maltose/moltooligosaccharide transporter
MTFWQIWNMSFGFMGIQLGFALQNSNASGILRNYGAEIEQLSWFWLAAPIVGMVVQPIVGHYSDRTWNRLGRRKPYFLAGALFSSGALLLMPNAWILGSLAPLMFIGAGFLMIMDASFNLAMEPFRALVADNLPEEQRTLGFSVQTSLIGVGAVVGSWLPWALARLGVADTAPEGEVALNVQLAFYIGAALFILTILWTIIRTREFSPTEYKAYHGKGEEQHGGLLTIFRDFSKMPRTMRQLGLVQFFSWFALFGMWVFTTDTIATHIFGLPVTDRSSPAYREAQNWTGIIFGVYNLVSAVYALFLSRIAAGIGRKKTHALSLILGGIGLLSIYFAPNKEFLIISMVLVGIAWASILAMPYVILSSSIPPGKMGIYMGIFNFFITIPQILNGLIGGPMVRHVYNNEPVYALVLSGIFFISAAVSVIFVYDPADLRAKGAETVARTI